MNLKDILQALHSLPNEKQQSDYDAECLIFATANCHFPSLEVKNIDAGTIVTDIVASLCSSLDFSLALNPLS